MIHLQHLLNFPSLLAARQDSWKVLRPEIVKVQKKDKTTVITGKTKTYQQQIELTGDKATLSSPAKCSCTCDSFKFEFAYALNANEGLLTPSKFEASISKPPREKNKFNKPSGCKHIIAFARLLTKRLNTLRI